MSSARWPVSLGWILSAPLLVAGWADAQVGTAVGRTVIGDASGGLAGLLQPDDYFGSALARIGDVDGDGIEDLAVGAPDEAFPATDEDSIWIVFLRADGTARAAQRLAEGVGGFSDPRALAFGWSVCGAGDIDGDGIPDVAAGVSAHDGGPGRGALWILFLNRDGTVRAQQRISQTAGGFTGTLRDEAGFGLACAPLGDVDGDGVAELAVGAPGPTNGTGAVWILHLARDGTVRTQHVLNATDPVLAPHLDQRDRFGAALAPLGDLDRDGDLDLAVAGPRGQLLGKVWVLRLAADQTVEAARVVPAAEVLPPDPDPYYPSAIAAVPDLDGDGDAELAISTYNFRLRGAVAIVRLARDGSVERSALMASETGGLPRLREIDFGYSLAPLGDLDGDGRPELAVGAPEADEEKGAVWVLELDDDPERTSHGRNVPALVSSGEPRLGKPWTLKLDCTNHAPGLGLVLGVGRALPGVPTVAGELLIDLASPRYFRRGLAHASEAIPFSLAVPDDIALFNLELHVQGACTGDPGPRLSNALDVILGR